ncbi:small integral membrane protein 8 [Phymastichus coffea]|uniref:small integral membrane protein 8 n=1 Tax=Phymastichus coffea TaxID=108790 RepID=UPI00273CA8ED|nr:small integral membrane protein 8 [Phymastichus coffea]
MENEVNKKHIPGDGLRSLRSTSLFRAINFELYVKPNKIIMAFGLIAMAGASGYIIYMRSKYEKMGYYTAVESDGTESFKKRASKWDL